MYFTIVPVVNMHFDNILCMNMNTWKASSDVVASYGLLLVCVSEGTFYTAFVAHPCLIVCVGGGGGCGVSECEWDTHSDRVTLFVYVCLCKF